MTVKEAINLLNILIDYKAQAHISQVYNDKALLDMGITNWAGKILQLNKDRERAILLALDIMNLPEWEKYVGKFRLPGEDPMYEGVDISLITNVSVILMRIYRDYLNGELKYGN